MSKKDAALHGMSKKDRRKLEERTAEIAAELARREAKAAKKSGKADKPKKGKAGKKAKAAAEISVDAGAALGVMTIGPEAPIETAPEEALSAGEDFDAEERHPHLVHLDRVGELAVIVADESAKPKKRAAAQAELDVLRAEGEKINAENAATDAEVKKRVAAKRAAREKGKPDDVDRDDEAAVTAYNEAEAASGGGHFITSNAEKARRDAELKGDAPVTEAEATAIEKTAEAVAAIKSAVAEVETETGRIFEAGASVGAEAEATFAKPSEAGPELEEGRNGYKIMKLGADGKPDPRTVRQFTRVTTFVGNIDDETMIRDWEKRLLAVGLSANAAELTPRVNEITHNRDVAIAKAQKADRKGRLDIGELASLEAAATKAWRDAVNAIVNEALEAAGRHDKADAGTNLHTLAEIADEKGMDAIDAMLETEEITATVHASIAAYSARMARLSAKVIESEAVVVNDELGYAGRLDRVIMAKLPEITLHTPAGPVVRPADVRSRRYVTDIKSGRIDLGAGKISRQLAAYALGDLYDLETGERSKHGAARDIALVFHLPQDAGVCTVHAVDLKEGARLLKLSAEVRKARNTGKKTIDTSVDIADPAPGGVVLDTEVSE